MKFGMVTQDSSMFLGGSHAPILMGPSTPPIFGGTPYPWWNGL